MFLTSYNSFIRRYSPLSAALPCVTRSSNFFFAFLVFLDTMRFLYLFLSFVVCLNYNVNVLMLMLLNVSPPFHTPIPFTQNLPIMLVVSRFVQRTLFSYNYVTVDLIKIIFLIFPWVILLLLNIIRINVRHVNFRWNLSILPMHYETISLVSHTFKLWVYV